MSAASDLPPQARKEVRRDTLQLVALLVAAVVCVSAVVFVFFQTRNNESQSRVTVNNNEAALCRAQFAADDAANLSLSQNVTLNLIKGLILRNFEPDAIVKEIDAQTAKNTASADARQNSVDTCEAVKR